jgi:hypothetical protein
MAKCLPAEVKQLRVDLVESMVEFVKRNHDIYDEVQVAELTKQIKRVAKFLGVVNAADQ